MVGTITYNVSLVESINPASNHLDAFQFLSSGLVGNTRTVDLSEKLRGEVSIPLPIKSFKVSKSELEDLSLADFTPPTKRVAKEAPNFADVDKKITVEKQTEFEERTITNSGLLKQMIKALSAGVRTAQP